MEIEYIPNFLPDIAADWAFEELLTIDWEQRDDVPRKEYYCNDTNVPYTYGRGAGIRTYYPKPAPTPVHIIRYLLELHLNTKLDVCFLNYYETSRNHLGWHSDDSPEMDPERPIVSVSLGGERPLLTRPIFFGTEFAPELVSSYPLSHGSAFIMPAGFQQKFQHKIPKVGYQLGPRISLTFRGYKPPDRNELNDQV